MTTDFKVGDRVYVIDPALAQLRAVMAKFSDTEPPPNNHGTIIDVGHDGSLIVCFDEDGEEAAGNAAPYHPSEVRHLA